MSILPPLIAGNWKMNGVADSLGELDAVIAWSRSGERSDVDLLICPPATLIERAARRAGEAALAIGGQDCHPQRSGAHTGDISADMIRDAGGSHVIVGHSERRADHGETDAMVAAKAGAAIAAGLVPLVCVGETEDQRDAGEADAVVSGQLAGSLPDRISEGEIIVAYEPVWAIGTGRTPSLDDIAAMHATIRAALVARFGPAGERARLLYGGSVKPDNAAGILALSNVDGALVGGASLTAASLVAIAAAAPRRG